MWRKSIVVFGAALLLLANGVLSTSLADPPWDPGNGTVFAPITTTERKIGLDLVAEGLTSPLKGVVAPGEPDTLYVVDQPGQIWAIDVTVPRPPAVQCPSVDSDDCVLFHDVGVTGLDQLVTLGCVPESTKSFGGSFDERGLLGLAFHPGFGTSGENRFYTYTSEPNKLNKKKKIGGPGPTFPTTLPGGPGTGDHQNVVAEWQAFDPGDPSAGVDPLSRRELMRVDWPQFNHDGGDLAFGPDGMLYISMGDGGGADDRDKQFFIDCGSDPTTASAMVGHGLDGNGQKLTNPLGKILRIDVDGSNSRNKQYGIPVDNPFVGVRTDIIEEIFAFGLRNPYRFSFDMRTGDLYVGNVGQNDIEEVELVDSGANLGWPIMEGTLFFDHNFNADGFATPDQPDFDPTRATPQMLAPDLVDPIAQYDTHHEGHAIIGGFVYRGSAFEQLKMAGRYIFGDFSVIFRFPIGPQGHGRLFHLQPGPPGQNLQEIEELQIVPSNRLSMALLGWGEDADGELYPMGNISGLPFFDEGVVLKMVPAD